MQCNEAFYLFSPERTPFYDPNDKHIEKGEREKNGLLQKHSDIVGIKLQKDELIMKFADWKSERERERKCVCERES